MTVEIRYLKGHSITEHATEESGLEYAVNSIKKVHARLSKIVTPVGFTKNIGGEDIGVKIDYMLSSKGESIGGKYVVDVNVDSVFACIRNEHTGAERLVCINVFQNMKSITNAYQTCAAWMSENIHDDDLSSYFTTLCSKETNSYLPVGWLKSLWVKTKNFNYPIMLIDIKEKIDKGMRSWKRFPI